MSELNEIKGLAEKANTAFTALRSEIDGLKSEAKDYITAEKHDKMASEVTTAMEKLQAVEAKAMALEAALARGEMGGDKADTEAEAKASAALVEFKAAEGNGKLEIRAMSTDSQPDGGFLVMRDLSSKVIGRIFETSPLRLIANVEQSGTKSREFLIDDQEAAAYWTGERNKATEGTPQLGIKEITVHEIGADMKATQTMIEDAYFSLEAWLRGKGADKIARTENTAFVTGDGVAKPRGFLDYAAWTTAGVYQRDALERINSGAAADLTADGLIDLQSSLKEAYQTNANWMMKRATFGRILKMKGNDQFYFGQMMLKDGVSALQLLGKRVIFADDMPAHNTASNLPVAYGDFREGYTILDRTGLTVLRDPFTGRPYTTFAMTKRTGGDVTNFEAIKLLKVSA